MIPNDLDDAEVIEAQGPDLGIGLTVLEPPADAEFNAWRNDPRHAYLLPEMVEQLDVKIEQAKRLYLAAENEAVRARSRSIDLSNQLIRLKRAREALRA